MLLKKIEFTDSSKLSNLIYISFFGLANGLNLFKTNNINFLKQNFLKIKYIDFIYYTDASQWVQKAYYDNVNFTPNANTRYDLLRPFTRLDLTQHDSYQYQSSFNLFLDNQRINLFPNQNDAGNNNLKLPDHLELNAITDNVLTDTIDFQANITLLQEYETPNFKTPNILITMLIEKLGNKINNAIQL